MSEIKDKKLIDKLNEISQKTEPELKVESTGTEITDKTLIEKLNKEKGDVSFTEQASNIAEKISDFFTGTKKN